MRILLVEDDKPVAMMVCRLLSGAGFVVDTCHTGRGAVEQARGIPYDIILLDWQLPDLDGVGVLRELRENAFSGPVMMLTSRSTSREKAFVLDAGADDYVVKPFDPEELVARIRAVLRRTQQLGEIRIEGLHLDRLRHTAVLDGKRLDLSPKEIDFLFCLAAKQGRIVTKAELLRDVWGFAFDPGSNIVEVTVSRMRRKLDRFAWIVETTRGRGYSFRSARDETERD